MSSQSRTVVLVDAVRTPFGKAGSLYAGTRAQIAQQCESDLHDLDMSDKDGPSYAFEDRLTHSLNVRVV